VTLRIGTRTSQLAIVQAEAVRAALAEVGEEAEIVPMTTSGDEGADPADSSQGLKGLWIDSILDALREGRIDLAVHSAKDLPADMGDDLVIGAVPRRADPRDVLVSRTEDLRLGKQANVGTSSIRRAAQLRAASPGIEIRELRGNVDTRLRKLFEGAVGAAVLAAAGIRRLGLEPAYSRPLEPEEMLPAPGQGAIAVQCRTDDRALRAKLSLIDHAPSHAAVDAERELMLRFEGGCALPLGALARERHGKVELVAVIASPTGSRLARAAVRAESPLDAAEAAQKELLREGANDILAAMR
jgi:hydroxymethylbilane synthase